MSKSEKVKTMSELLNKMNKAREGDVCECEEMKSTFVFKNNGWECIRTTQEGYKELYETGEEQ